MTLTSVLGQTLQTHGLGGSTDLPILFLYAMVGASWALTISFAVLALAWKEPQFSSAAEPGAVPPRRPWLAVLGVLVTGWFLGALFFGPSDTINGGLGGFYIFVWVGLVPLALLAGQVWLERCSRWLPARPGESREASDERCQGCWRTRSPRSWWATSLPTT